MLLSPLNFHVMLTAINLILNVNSKVFKLVCPGARIALATLRWNSLVVDQQRVTREPFFKRYYIWKIVNLMRIKTTHKS